MTSFVDVTGGMSPLQAQQSLNAAQTGTRDEIDWANKQALRNIQSKHTNDDGSLDQFGLIHEAASAGIGPDAVKAWLSNQNDTNAAATNQTNTNFLLKTLNLNPNALRDQSKLPGTPGAGQNNTIDGESLAPGQSIQYNNEQGAGVPVGPSTLDIDKSPSTSDEVRARAAARAQNGAAAFTPSTPDAQPVTQGNGAAAFVPKPVTGAKAMTSEEQTQKSSQALAGNEVEVKAKNEEANDGGTFTAPAPEDNSQTITSTPDRRSILERLADSGSGTPTIPGADGSSVSNDEIFNYKNVVARGGLNLKAGLDATLSKFGKTTDQKGVNELLYQAALGVTPPTPQTKDGKLDPFATATAVAEYKAKVIAAKTAMAKALADGNTVAVGEILAQSKYRHIEQPEAARAAKLYGEGQLTVQQLAAKGYKGVNPSNAAEYQKVDTDLEVAKGIVDGVNDLTKDIRSNPRMDKDELATRTSTFLLRMLGSDGAGTEGAGDMILGSLGAPKSIRQQWAETKIGGVKELPSTVSNFLRTALTKNKPTDFANLLDDQAKGLIKYGAAGRAAKAHGLQNPFGEPTGPGAFTPKPSAGSGRASKKGR